MDAYGVPPYQPSPYPAAPPAEPPRRLRGLATALTVLFSVMIAVLVLNALALMLRISLVNDVRDGEFVSAEDADGADAFVVLTGVLYLLMLIAIAVVFIVWQFRHAKNAQLLGSADGLSPGWAIGGWFIPLANFVLPAMQIFGASRFSARRSQYDPHTPGSGASIVVWWALALGIGSALTTLAFWAAPADNAGSEEYLDDLATSDQLEAMGGIVLIAAAILAIVMVRSLSSRQESAIAEAGVGGHGPSGYWGGSASPGGYYVAPPGAQPGGFPPPGPYQQPGGHQQQPTQGEQPPAGWTSPPVQPPDDPYAPR